MTQPSQHTLCNRQGGFTLIEVMVAVSIFAIIMTVGIGALFSINASYRKSQSQRAAFDSLNFVVDTLARDIRTGTRYVQSSDPSEFDNGPVFNAGVASDSFSFRNQDGCDVTYQLQTSSDGGAIERRFESNPTLECISSNQSFQDLTNTDIIDVTGLHFYLRGSDTTNNDTSQPMASFVIQAETRSGSASTDVVLQTTVTQRFLDIPGGS